uniref:Uncharacterized protein n=1 Tax=Hyaloperonospora arabidopsidis (strain Emoy2) TaxID=559515 RepID=M4B5K4_HYAAE
MLVLFLVVSDCLGRCCWPLSCVPKRLTSFCAQTLALCMATRRARCSSSSLRSGRFRWATSGSRFSTPCCCFSTRCSTSLSSRSTRHSPRCHQCTTLMTVIMSLLLLAMDLRVRTRTCERRDFICHVGVV